MHALETAIKDALDASGDSKKANKAYLEFIKANFIVPVEKNTREGEPEVLYLQDDLAIYLPVFSNRNIFDQWVHDIRDDVQVLTLSGVDLLKGIGDDITVSLNIGSPIYKEFNPSELARMRSMVIKIWSK